MAPTQRKLEEKTRDIFRACVLFRGLPGSNRKLYLGDRLYRVFKRIEGREC